jgi:uncharacterized protein YndB with AHSA1/START domain
MIDLLQHLDAVHRQVSRTGDEVNVLLKRNYPAGVEDVWDALTDPERMRRWFMPITGELKVGGSFQLQGNAGGEILECVEPERLRVSWLYGPDPGFSEVEVRLTPEDGERTVVELEHVAVVPDDFWDQFGPGAVGVGWDLGLYGLALHLAGGGIGKEEAVTWHTTPEGGAFITGSGEGWGEAYAASGADEETVTGTTARTIAFYTGTQAP